MMAVQKPESKTNKFKTFKDVFDASAERVLFKLQSQGYFERLESPISIGKESNIFTAIRADGMRVILKMYRVSNCDFNKMYSYMKEDPRFTGVKPNQRQVVFAWARREYVNLLKARSANVSVPTPFVVMKNIVVMEFIGNGDPSPKLKDALPKDPRAFYNEVVANYKKLFAAGMVHGDLSPFNILTHHEHPVFIDMSQSTTLDNPQAENYLKRDARNLAVFFNKLGVRAEGFIESVTS